jgi:hypothetical protein
MGFQSTLGCAPAPVTTFLTLNPDGTPTDPSFNINASQVTGLDPGVAPANTINIIPQVTGLTGGGPTNLDGVPTANLPTYYVLAVFQPASGFWRLELDTDPISFGTVVTPLDHTNRSWRQRG